MNTSPARAGTSGHLHVVVGAGAVGSALAGQLLDLGHRVRVLTRSTTRPASLDPRVEHVAADASDPAELTRLTTGATVLYNAANPRDYHRWAQVWPPLAASMLVAAERSGAVLATVGNLYAYGPVDGALHEGLTDAATFPHGRIRAQMWADALAAHRAGRVRAVEVRASDYVGAGCTSHLSRAAELLLAGKRTVRLVGAVDQPHSWTGTADTARTLIAAAADESALGRTWIVPSNPPLTQGEAVRDLAAALGRPTPRVVGSGRRTVRAAGLVVPVMRPMLGVLYQFDRPFVVDDSAARERFGIEPTPWAELVAQTAGRVAVAA